MLKRKMLYAVYENQDNMIKIISAALYLVCLLLLLVFFLFQDTKLQIKVVDNLFKKKGSKAHMIGKVS